MSIPHPELRYTCNCGLNILLDEDKQTEEKNKTFKQTNDIHALYNI